MIVMDGVKKEYDGKSVLSGVSLSVEQGQLLALLGPSGCGKTTLLNALAGLVDIDGGNISVGGKTYSSKGFTLPPEERRIGMVFQDFALWPHMTVFENVAFGLKVQKLSRSETKERVREVLEIVRMKGYEDRYPHRLSGGQKQRVAIARALAPRPNVLLMDEPLSSLDAKLREEMRWHILDIVRKTEVTTVYVTHDQIEALTMADRVILLNQGKIEQQGAPMELYDFPNNQFCASFVGASNLIPCKVTNNTGNVAKVDCGGFLATAVMDREFANGEAVWMVRPSHIVMASGDFQPGTQGTLVAGVVEQRAFLGNVWQFHVRLRDHEHILLEVWDETPRHVGEPVTLWIETSKARLVEPAING